MDIYSLEKSIINKYNTTNQYLWKLTGEEKEFLKSTFYFTKDIKSQIVCLMNKVYKQPKCETCGKEIKNLVKNRDTINRYCSSVCSVKSDEIRSKMSNSHKNIPSEGKESLQKLFKNKLSLMGKFNIRHLEIENSIIEKHKNSSQWHHHLSEDELFYLNDMFYFVDNLSTKIKCLKQNIFEVPKCLVCLKDLPKNKIGLYKHCNNLCKYKNDEINNRISKSVCESIDSDIRVRSGRKWREYILPSGKIVSVQGYEPEALNILLQTYSEKEIEIHPKFFIKYKFEGKIRRHKPDFYIKKENKIIEVKSIFTYNDDLDKNLAKKDSAIKQGYDYRFMIIGETKNGKKEIEINGF